jgi:hypothetical protein
MPRYLIVVPHEAETVACARAVKLLLETGSHFLTHADFGCDEARRMLPPLLRPIAEIVGLNRFSLEELDDLLKHHGG